MFCGQCGSKLTETNKFCPQCGAPVSAPQPAPVVAAAPSATPEPAIAPVAAAEPVANVEAAPMAEVPAAPPVYQAPALSAPINNVFADCNWSRLGDSKNIISVLLAVAIILSMLIFPIVSIDVYEVESKYSELGNRYYDSELAESFSINMLSGKTDFDDYDKYDALHEMDSTVSTPSKIVFAVTIILILAYIFFLANDSQRTVIVLASLLLAVWLIYIILIFGLVDTKSSFGEGLKSDFGKFAPVFGTFVSPLCVIGLFVTTIIRNKKISLSWKKIFSTAVNG